MVVAQRNLALDGVACILDDHAYRNPGALFEVGIVAGLYGHTKQCDRLPRGGSPGVRLPGPSKRHQSNQHEGEPMRFFHLTEILHGQSVFGHLVILLWLMTYIQWQTPQCSND